jgi:vacuolar-type H+-ATPase subunit I/STV1
MATMKDPYTNKTVEVPDELEDFVQNIISFNRRKGGESKQRDIDALQEKINEMSGEVEAAKKAGTTGGKELEALKKDYDKKIEALTAERDNHKNSADENGLKYMDMRRRTEIFSKLPVSDLYNVDDTLEKISRSARWIKRMDAAKGEQTGEVDLVLTMSVKDEKTGKVKTVDFAPDEGIKHFLADPSNAYLLKNKLATGSERNTGANGQTSITVDQKTAIPEEQFYKMGPKERAAFMAEGGAIKQ